MNLLLVDPQEVSPDNHVIVTDRRFHHVRDVLKLQSGETLRAGAIGGKMGTALITQLTDKSVELKLDLHAAPPAPLELDLFMALPRPKFIPRVVQAATSLGVKQLTFFNSYRVDKIYWSCAQLSDDQLKSSLRLGLEQARDTVEPTIHFERLFKPFVQDRLPQILKGRRALLAHPGAKEICPYGLREPVALAIGPEGGFIDYEIDLLQKAGMTPVRTFERILKVETALASLIGRLF